MTQAVIQHIVLTLAAMLATGAAGFAVGKVRRHSKIDQARIEIEKATARKDIFDYYERHVVRGEHLTIAKYDEIVREYEAYKVLGGNGTAEAYMAAIREIKPYMVVG